MIFSIFAISAILALADNWRKYNRHSYKWRKYGVLGTSPVTTKDKDAKVVLNYQNALLPDGPSKEK